MGVVEMPPAFEPSAPAPLCGGGRLIRVDRDRRMPMRHGEEHRAAENRGEQNTPISGNASDICRRPPGAAAARHAFFRQQRDQARGDGGRFRSRPAPIRQARDHRRQALRRLFPRQQREPGRFLPGIEAEPGERRKHGEERVVPLLADRREQKFVELGSQQRERGRQRRCIAAHVTDIRGKARKPRPTRSKDRE